MRIFFLRFRKPHVSVIRSREEVSTPLSADVYIGLRDTDGPTDNDGGHFVADVHAWSVKETAKQAMLPKAMGRKMVPNVFDVIETLRKRKTFKERGEYRIVFL